MPLRLVNKDRTHPITACDTTFNIISMTVGEKDLLLLDIQNVGQEEGAFDRLCAVIKPAIISIDGYEEDPITIIQQMEDITQVAEIVKAIVAHCSLTQVEVKNLQSSPVQATPDSGGTVENDANPESDPASTIPTKMA